MASTDKGTRKKKKLTYFFVSNSLSFSVRPKVVKGASPELNGSFLILPHCQTAAPDTL